MSKTKLTPRETELRNIFGKTGEKIPAKVITYLRKNPRNTGRRIVTGTPLFGKYEAKLPSTVISSVNRNLDRITGNWAGLYTRNQLKTYLKK